MEPSSNGTTSRGFAAKVTSIWRWCLGKTVQKKAQAEQDAMFIKIQNTCPCQLRTERTTWCELAKKNCTKRNCIAYFVLKFNWPTPPVNHEKKRSCGKS